MEIGDYLVKLFQITKELNSLDFFMGKTELSGTEFRLMQEVVAETKKGNKIISSELARRLGITRSAVSQIVTKLEARNIVKRTPSETDRKIAYIRLSDYAAQIFEQQCKSANLFMERVAERFGVERLNHLIEEYDAAMKICRELKKETEGE